MFYSVPNTSVSNIWGSIMFRLDRDHKEDVKERRARRCLSKGSRFKPSHILGSGSRYGVPKRTKLFFARADLIHFISRALMPVHHGRIVSTSFYNTTIPMTICSVATFITKSQSKSELQVSEDGEKRYTTMAQSCERF